jgi:hypothetical protein
VPIIPLWYAGTIVGVVAGTAIPASWGLDFVVPLTFLAIIAPALRTLGPCGRGADLGDGGAAAGVDPWNLGLLIAGSSA